jgi:hypothetical protein
MIILHFFIFRQNSRNDMNQTITELITQVGPLLILFARERSFFIIFRRQLGTLLLLHYWYGTVLRVRIYPAKSSYLTTTWRFSHIWMEVSRVYPTLVPTGSSLSLYLKNKKREKIITSNANYPSKDFTFYFCVQYTAHRTLCPAQPQKRLSPLLV